MIVVLGIPELEVRLPFAPQGTAAINEGFADFPNLSDVKVSGNKGAVRKVDRQGLDRGEEGLNF